MSRLVVSAETKAAAIADLLTGEQPAVVAERYDLNPATVRSWKARLETSATPGATPHATPAATVVRRPVVDARQQTLAELVEANLRAKLIATQRIAEHVTRDEWLDKQTAADVGELFGVLDRSAIGILDRLAGAQRHALPDSAASEG